MFQHSSWIDEHFQRLSVWYWRCFTIPSSKRKEERLKQKTKKGNGTLSISVYMPINLIFYQMTNISMQEIFLILLLSFWSEYEIERTDKQAFLQLTITASCQGDIVRVRQQFLPPKELGDRKNAIPQAHSASWHLKNVKSYVLKINQV